MKNDKETEFEITSTKIEPREKKLEAGWKSWSCPKCALFMLYKGKRPVHKDCPGHMIVLGNSGLDLDAELVTMDSILMGEKQ